MTEKSYPWGDEVVGDATLAPYSDDFWSDFQRMLYTIDRKVIGLVPMRDSNLLGYTIGAGKVTIASGEALVDGKFYQNDANVDINLPTPAAATRVDVIVLRKGWTAQTIRLTRVAGTEGAGVPAITQTDGVTWDVPLYTFQITTGGVITLYLDNRVIIDSPLAGNGLWMFNKSGGTLEKGSVVISDLVSNDSGVTTTTVESDRRILGVALNEAANNGAVKVGYRDRQAQIKITGAVQRGEWLIPSSTVKLAKAAGFGKPAAGAIGVALEAGLNGFVKALLDVDINLMISGGSLYFAGGLNGAAACVTTNQKLSMISETCSGVGSGLNAAKKGITGGQSVTAGYGFGGNTYGAAGNCLQGNTTMLANNGERMFFSTESFSVLSSMALSSNRTWVGGLTGSYSVYLVGGNNGTAYVATSDKMPLSTETTSSQASANTSAIRGCIPYSGVTNKVMEKGFALGGYSGGQVAIADRCQYSTDTTSAVVGANLSAARADSFGNIQDASYAFAQGGNASNVADKISWAGETSSVQASANLSSNRGGGAGGCTVTAGYTLGGMPNSSTASTVVGTCDKLNLSTMNNNNVVGGALVASQGGGAYFNSLV
jgi:hypothetical protein